MLHAGLALQALIVTCWILAFICLWQAMAALRGMPLVPDLSRMDLDALPSLGSGSDAHITVIVPACNEERKIEATLRSLLASTGVRLQIIGVNDRSTDASGAIMDRIAAEARPGSPHWIEVVHISELPAGWLGKPHALHVGAARATAPWLLFTDGDVLFEPRALELALRFALRERASHVVLPPQMMLHSVGEAAMLTAMQLLSQFPVRFWKIADPRARDSVGMGAFNLVCRRAFDATGGFEPLKFEVVEDLRLGRRIKRAGFTERVVLGRGLVRMRWIEGWFGIVGLAEKNGFAVFRYRVLHVLIAAFLLFLCIAVPLAAIVAGGWAAAAGMLFYLSIVTFCWSQRRVTSLSPWYGLLFAPACAILLYTFLRSMFMALFRQGIVWRGTLYPLAMLRRHAREEEQTGFICPAGSPDHASS
jgi:glycosyltransferase involved in cell wall biosynthesis